MDLIKFIKTHKPMRAYKLINRNRGTVERWVKSGKKYVVIENETGGYDVWEKK